VCVGGVNGYLTCAVVRCLAALADTEWPGRTQTVRHGPVTYFLDGAHTMPSMQACVKWFQEAAVRSKDNKR